MARCGSAMPLPERHLHFLRGPFPLFNFSLSEMPSFPKLPSTNGASRTIQQRTSNLLQFTSSLTYTAIPPPVIERTKSFLLDTLACSIAGHGHPAVQSLLSFSEKMGPESGKCTFFFDRKRTTSAAFAALVNGASTHVVELDDLNNAGMIHPVTPTPFSTLINVGNSGIPSDFCSCRRCWLFR